LQSTNQRHHSQCGNEHQATAAIANSPGIFVGNYVYSSDDFSGGENRLQYAGGSMLSIMRQSQCTLVYLAVTLFASTGWAQTQKIVHAGTWDTPPLARGFMIQFGAGSDTPTDFSGELSISGGEIHSLQGQLFTKGDQIHSTSKWTTSTISAAFSTGAYPMSRAVRRTDAPKRIFPKSVVAYVSGGDQTRVTVKTVAGEFAFTLGDVDYDKSQQFLDGRALVTAIPAASRRTDREYEDDYPALCQGSDGTIWLSYQSYKNEADRLNVQRFTGTTWGAPEEVSKSPGDIYKTAIAADGSGNIHLVWSERLENSWNLYTRNYNGRRWSDIEQLTTGQQPDIMHKLATGPDGQLYLVWQGFHNGQSDIFLRRFNGKTWMPTQQISTDAANDWQPSAAVAPDGTVWIVWDTYTGGRYDVRMRSWKNGTLGPVIPVTDSQLFEANSNVTVGADGRVWVAWEESGPNWGKDTNLFSVYGGTQQKTATRLYETRQVRVACYDGLRWLEPLNELLDAIPSEYRKYAQFPELSFDADGRLWAFIRCRTRTVYDRRDGWANYGGWEFFAIPFDGDAWMPSVYLFNSVGRNEVRLAHLFDGERFHVAWAGDNRPFSLLGGFEPSTTDQTSIYSAIIEPPAVKSPAITPAEMILRSRTIRNQPMPPVHPNEKADVARIRNYTALVGGEAFKIYRGDTHRHTDISNDGAGDGSVLDLFRYALDVTGYDFMMIGDHDMGGLNEYHWWRTEKFIDLFHLRGQFTTLFGCERSVPYPNGHRNVIFPRRGVRPLERSQKENKGEINTGSVLYPWLKENGGLAISHSSPTTQGTDWRDNDPELEPVMELYQGYHISAEYVGAPLGLQRDADGNPLTPSVHGQYRDDGMWWEALRKGYRMGVVASSDHQSTHMSHACIYSPEPSRTAIIESLRKRQAYAATDNIIMDFRASDGEQEYFMGADVTFRRNPRIRAKIIGTCKISKLELIKNFAIVLSQSPNQQHVDFQYLDTRPEEGENFYYLRAIQEDGNIAWATPIWITYKP
jgi:hypothetical protein